MVRKRLSDLLHEEAEKFTPPEGESVIEVSAEEIKELDEDNTSKSQEIPISAKRTSPTKADLEITVKELQENLEQAKQQHKALEQKIADLQSALSEQKASVQRVTKELDETKKAALQLAEANSKLIEESTTLKQEQEQEQKLEREREIEREKEKESKSLALQKQKEPYNPVGYKKSHRTSERLAENQTQTNDDFAANTWLYD